MKLGKTRERSNQVLREMQNRHEQAKMRDLERENTHVKDFEKRAGILKHDQKMYAVLRIPLVKYEMNKLATFQTSRRYREIQKLMKRQIRLKRDPVKIQLEHELINVKYNHIENWERAQLNKKQEARSASDLEALFRKHGRIESVFDCDLIRYRRRSAKRQKHENTELERFYRNRSIQELKMIAREQLEFLAFSVSTGKTANQLRLSGFVYKQDLQINKLIKSIDLRPVKEGCDGIERESTANEKLVIKRFFEIKISEHKKIQDAEIASCLSEFPDITYNQLGQFMYKLSKDFVCRMKSIGSANSGTDIPDSAESYWYIEEFDYLP